MQKGRLDITHTLMANAGELEEARLQRGLAYLGLGKPVAARAENVKRERYNLSFDNRMITMADLLGC